MSQEPIEATKITDLLGEDDPLDLSKVLTDEELTAVPPEEKIKRLAKLCREQLSTESELADMEIQLAHKKEELAKLSEHDIPDLMDEIGIDEFRLSSGVRVKVNPYYSGKITTPEAMEWLEDNDHGDIIKGSLTIPYPKGFDQKLLQTIVLLAKEINLPASNDESVHHSTLKAWIKEMIETGQEFPRELFNVYVGRKTKLSIK